MFKKALTYFLTWRIAVFFVAFLSIYFIPRWGDWFPYSDRVLIPTGLPNWIWGFGNFDGVHYLRIAQNGYGYIGSHAFFPLYVLVVRYLSYIFPKTPGLDINIFVDKSYFFVAFLFSNIVFVVAMYFFYKLVSLDFGKKVALLSLMFLLAFPTSFYFGAVYTEGLFLLLASSSIYFIRKKSFILGGLLAGLTSATKVVGICLLPLLLIELYLDLKNRKGETGIKTSLRNVASVALASSGLVAYSYYLWKYFGNAIFYISSQPLFGQERSAGPFILLPQVIYRYIKIFLNTPVMSMKFFNAGLEFVFTLGALTLLVLFIKKMRFSYWIFTFGVLIIPTLTGTFNSMPRYVLTGFLLIPFIVTAYKKYLKPVIIISVILGALLISLFVRGYWVA